MAIGVLVIGNSGSGKSTSIRNLDTKSTAIINCGGKPLPFKGSLRKKVFNASGYNDVMKGLMKWGNDPAIKTIIIDDFQYMTGNEVIDRIYEKGFDKFNDLANHTVQLVRMAGNLPADKIIYYMAHEETDANGRITPLTFGKFVREKYAIEGVFTICLRTKVVDSALGDFRFATVNSGNDTVKAPMGMFDGPDIPNDLALVNQKIDAFYSDDEDFAPKPIEEPVVPQSSEPVNTPPLPTKEFPPAEEVAKVVADVRAESNSFYEAKPVKADTPVRDWTTEAKAVIKAENLGIRIKATDTEESVWQRIETRRGVVPASVGLPENAAPVETESNYTQDAGTLEYRLVELFGTEADAVAHLMSLNMLPSESTSLSALSDASKSQLDSFWDRFVMSVKK